MWIFYQATRSAQIAETLVADSIASALLPGLAPPAKETERPALPADILPSDMAPPLLTEVRAGEGETCEAEALAACSNGFWPFWGGIVFA